MDTSALSTAKDLMATAKPFVEPLIAVLLAPKIKSIEAFLKKKGSDKKITTQAIEDSFKDYLIGSYQKFCTMNILVFPNQQIIIKDIYQPLTLVSHKINSTDTIDVFKEDFIAKYERILISDTAGMGKSTLMKWIGASIIEQQFSIPVLIELKRISDKHKLIDEICTQFGNIFGDFDKDVILHLVNTGQFIFLLDGFDEVRYEFKEFVIDDIKKFVHKSTKNYYIITSRPESSLTAFGDFQLFNIHPLTPDESFQLIKKYDKINLNKVGDRLIIDIKDKLSQVREFLTNPFLVSLLYKTYTYNKDIPSKKTTFYEEVYSALYKHHDLSKDGFKRNKKSGLDYQDFRAVINQLAYDTAKAGKVEYSEQELLKILDELKPKCVGVSFKSSDFAEDIELNVPLFSREGNILKWAHKSLQDFFAASYISSSVKKEDIISKLYKTKRESFLNIIDFLFEMEFKLIRNIIVYEIASDFVNYCNNSFSVYNDIPLNHIRRRQEAAYDSSCTFVHTASNQPFSPTINRLLNSGVESPTGKVMYAYTLRKEGKSNTHAVYQSSKSFRHEIIKIIGIKNLPIAKAIDIELVYGRENDWHNKLVRPLPKECAFSFNEEKDNPLNNPANFDEFTNLLISDRVSMGNINYILDYDECLKLIQEVEESKEFDSDKDDLDGL